MESSIREVMDSFLTSQVSNASRDLGFSQDILRGCFLKRLESCHPSKFQYLHESNPSVALVERSLQTFENTLIDCQAFLFRLQSDIYSFSEMLGIGNTINSIELDLGDVHQDGKATCSFTMNGAKYIYRPRDLSFENTLQAIFNKVQLPRLHTQNVFHGSGFTISDFVQSSPLQRECLCDDLTALLTVHYIASITGLADLHCDNFIFGREGITPIDLEVFQIPKNDILRMKTGVFPDFCLKVGKEFHDTSALNYVIREHQLHFDEVTGALSKAIVDFKRILPVVNDFVEEEFHSKLLARRVHRPTMDYYQILRYIDDFYFCEEDREKILCERLTPLNPSHYEHPLEEEIQLLLKGYIPIYYESIDDISKQIDIIQTTSFQDKNLFMNLQYVDLSTRLFYLNQEFSSTPLPDSFHCNQLYYDIRLSKNTSDNELRESSRKLFCFILENVSQWIDRGVSGKDMFAIEPFPRAGEGACTELGHGIYSGFDGVLMYLCQAAKHLDVQQKQVQKYTLEYFDDFLNSDIEVSHAFGIPSSSLGSLYAGVFCFLTLGYREQAVALASKFLSSIPGFELKANGNSDLFLGLPGHLLLARQIEKKFPELEEARRLDPIIERYLFWLKEEHLPSPISNIGFSHGDAGLLYLLCQLFETESSRQYANLIEEMISRIQKSFDESGQRFRDYRHEDTFNQLTYCNGVLGIFLALKATEEIPLSESSHATVLLLINAAEEVLSTNGTVYVDTCCSDALYQIGMVSRRNWKSQRLRIRPGFVSLFKGSSGIAYLLLQELFDLPNPLLWELP